MDQRNQELLDKQLRRLNPFPQDEAVTVFSVLAFFLASVALGGFMALRGLVSAHKSEPMQIASNDATPAVSIPNGAPSNIRH